MKTKFLVIATGLILWNNGNAQVQLESLSQTLDYAHKNNVEIYIANSKLLTEQYNRLNNFGTLLPQIKAVSTLDNNFELPTQLIPAEFFGGPSGTYKPVQFGTNYNLTAGIEATMPLVNTSLWMETGIAKLNYEIALGNLKHSLHEIDKSIARIYYLCVVSMAARDIAKNNRQYADSIYQIAKIKFNNGLLEPMDFNRIQFSSSGANINYLQSQSVYEKYLINLKSLLAIPDSIELVLSDKNIVFNKAELKLINTENYPSITTKELQLKLAKKYYSKDNLKFGPEINLYGRYLAQAQRNEFNFFNDNQNWYAIGVAGIKIDWPLFTGTIRYNNIRKDKIRLDQAKLELENEQRKIAYDNHETLINYDLAIKVFEAQQESNKLAEQNIEVAFTKYTEGVFSIDQYLTIYNEALVVQNNWIKALAEVKIYQTTIELKNKL